MTSCYVSGVRYSVSQAKGNTIVIRENNGQNARWFDSESELKHWLQFSR